MLLNGIKKSKWPQTNGFLIRSYSFFARDTDFSDYFFYKKKIAK